MQVQSSGVTFTFEPLELRIGRKGPTKTLNKTLQSLHPQLLQPLTEAISRGFNGALLLCGASTEKVSTLIDHCVIKQVVPTSKLHFIFLK